MILLVDDDHAVCASLELLLGRAGHRCVSVDDPAAALARVEDPSVDLVLQDMNFSRRTSGSEGLDLLRGIRTRRPNLPVVLITAWGSIDLAVEGMKLGARDFVTKPWANAALLQTVETALGLAADDAARRRAPATPDREALDERFDLGAIVGEDPALLEVLDVVGRVAATDASVLVTGESGTGKELIADALHRNSRRRNGPLVKVNLAGLSPGLFESEMFGHVRGAFTDAHRDREGRFAAADHGTLFLDEVGDLDPTAQVKLLRVLQERRFEPVGSSRPQSADVRVVSATHRDLAQGVANGAFREDLLYRLNLITVHLPALRERAGDIPVLARWFLSQLERVYGRDDLVVDDDALRWLQQLPWPGNVRQLQQLLERTVLLADSPTLGVAELERTLGMEHPTGGEDELPAVGAMTLEEIERAMIEKSLRHHRSNISRAAASLGMSRAALYRRLKKHGIDA